VVGAMGGSGGSQDSARSGCAEGRGGQDFERALYDFSHKLRDVLHDTGLVGEAAARDLRRILDDTVEVIRRDMQHWGPPAEGTESDRQEPSEEAKGHSHRSSDSPSTDDPWGAAVDDTKTPSENERKDEDR